jgi:hypothetical protein
MFASFQNAQRLTQFLLALLVIGVWGLLLRPLLPSAAAGTPPTQQSATFDTLTVQRINVVEPDGKPRLVIANTARFPGAIVRGKEYPRSINSTAGILFFDESGSEIGGLALTKLGTDNMANLTFDYAYQPTDGIYAIRRESADGQHWQAGFGISDRRPYEPGPIESSQGTPRIALIDKDQDAQLLISDAAGHPRIRLSVPKSGEPKIEMLNAQGGIIYQAAK